MPSIAFYTLVGHFSMFGELSGAKRYICLHFLKINAYFEEKLIWGWFGVCAREARGENINIILKLRNVPVLVVCYVYINFFDMIASIAS